MNACTDCGKELPKGQTFHFCREGSGDSVGRAPCAHTRRIAAGSYVRAAGERSVHVKRHENGYWIARAEWTHDEYSDPCATLRDAIACADDFLGVSSGSTER